MEAYRQWLRTHPQVPRAIPQPGDQSYASLVAVFTREDVVYRPMVLPAHLSLAARRAHHALRVPPTGTALAATAAKATTAKAAAPAYSKRPAAYCWGHGHCTHTSTECKRPLPGHQVDATKAHTMGGATYHWERLSQEKRQQAMRDGPGGISA